MRDLHWQLCAFDRLDGRSVYDILRLRSEVFVVEQQCVYADMDGQDTLPGTRHLSARAGTAMVAYARSLVDDGEPQAPARLGRVVVARDWRGRGLASTLMQRLLDDLAERCPQRDVILSAQLPAVALYTAFGFDCESAPYLEDGIPHVAMRRAAR